MNTKPCVECGRPGLSAYQFRTTDPDTRVRWRDQGIRRIEARGLCQPCYRTAMRAGRLTDYERRNRDRAEILEDWELLAEPMVPLKREVRRLAPQFGMTEDALEAALLRAGVRSRFKGGHGERLKDVA